MSTQSIPLFYWSERKFASKENENYGDLLSKYLVEKISRKEVKWVHPKKQPWYKWDNRNYVTIGSVLHHASKDSIVWGSGIIDKKQHITKGDYRAVRGPQTRKFLLELGYECPKVYGDPALLLPKYYHPEVEKNYKVGIVPHYRDYKDVAEAYKDEKDILVIDLMTLDVETVTEQIMQCRSTISSSLHGVIVSHAYNIPSVWVEFSGELFGDGIKFIDYFESVDLKATSPIKVVGKKSMEELRVLVNLNSTLPTKEKIRELQDGLLRSFPLEVMNSGMDY